MPRGLARHKSVYDEARSAVGYAVFRCRRGDLGDLLVQVKSGNARGLTGQILRTQASTGTRTIGYAPDISDSAWASAAREGIPILRSPNELLAYVREFG